MQAANVCPTFPISTCAIPPATLDDKDIFDFVYHGNMLSKHHRDSPPLAKASRWNLSKFVVIKHFRRESLNVQPSCCLDVVVYMLNCVFWRHILLEIEFKSRVDMGSDSNRYTVQRYSP